MEVYKGDISGARITNGAGAIDAMVTAPIDKESAQSEAFQFTGHTEFMASHL